MKTLVFALMSALCLTTAHADETRTAATVVCDATFIKLQVDAPIFSKERSVHVSYVPKQYEGKSVTCTARGVDQPLAIEVKKRGVVTIIADKMISTDLEGLGWDKVAHIRLQEEGVLDTQEIPIFEKVLETGTYSIPGTINFGTRLILMKD
jgi:hypothetical protein